MNQQVNKYQQFDRFLNNEMTQSEEDHLNEELASDSNLSQELEEYKRLIGSVKKLEREQFRNQLFRRGNDIISHERQNEEDASNDKKIKSLWNRNQLLSISAAAACIVIILVPASIYFYSSLTKAEQLYNQYYSPYQNVVAPSIRGEEKKTAIQQALTSYTAKNYEQAIADIRETIDEYPDSKSEVGLYLGISYLETNNTAKAITTFKDIINTEKGLKEQARWYLAMSFLKRGETENAKKELEVLVDNPTSSYQDKAREVLEQL